MENNDVSIATLWFVCVFPALGASWLHPQIWPTVTTITSANPCSRVETCTSQLVCRPGWAAFRGSQHWLMLLAPLVSD